MPIILLDKVLRQQGGTEMRWKKKGEQVHN